MSLEINVALAGGGIVPGRIIGLQYGGARKTR